MRKPDRFAAGFAHHAHGPAGVQLAPAVRPAPAGRAGAVFEAVLPVAPTGVRV